jgi:hypothetical protein
MPVPSSKGDTKTRQRGMGGNTLGPVVVSRDDRYRLPMPVLTFSWMTDALLAGRLTAARREWGPAYRRHFTAGTRVGAYDVDPQRGGSHLATLRLTQDAVLEPVSQIPDSDYEAEGFAYFAEHGLPALRASLHVSWSLHLGPGESLWQAFERRRHGDIELTVVRFEVVSWTAEGKRRRQTLLAP